jgi:heme a synthase
MNTIQQSVKGKKWLLIWLYAGLVMIAIQVLLGGITRLTGSGLSITEWQPILGAFYPNSPAAWQLAFEKYKSIAQYKYLNNDFTLAQFKFIFFWEWLHRNWARAIGLVFFVPFVLFVIKGVIGKSNAAQYGILFIIGALQGLVGWIMVASGINDTNLFVNHFKLAAHFITALLAFVAVYWCILNLQPGTLHITLPVQKKLKRAATLLLTLLVIQLLYGALMAGLKGAPAASTWPSINGSFIPIGLSKGSWVSSAINVHFVHRNLAYIIALGIIYFTIYLKKTINTDNTTWIILPLLAVLLQISLGITTVLKALQPLRNAMGVFEWSALLHQFVALLLLLSLVQWLHKGRNAIIK